MARSGRIFACSMSCLQPLLCCAQLEKAQSQHARWQALGRTNPDKKRLEADIEDECKSIAWQARCTAFCYLALLQMPRTGLMSTPCSGLFPRQPCRLAPGSCASMISQACTEARQAET